MVVIIAFICAFSVLTVKPTQVASQAPKVTPDEVNLFLYTRANQANPDKIGVGDLSDLSNSHFIPSRLNYFVIHGIFSNYLSSLYAKDPLLNQRDVNVFLVDYSGPASSFEYHDEAIIGTGKILADFIAWIKMSYGLSADSFVLVGHSMGAHVAGEVGRNLNGDLGTIIALDPANMTPPIVYIDSGKAHFVQSILTSTVGLTTPVGHATYIPNTVNQPGCGEDSGCSHLRPLYLYAESITSGGFTSVKCDSYYSFISGWCNGNERSYFGGIDLDKSAYGTYYLQTNSQPPYSLG